MDPVTLVVSAVMAGVAAGTQDAAAEGVRAAWAKLKTLLRDRFGTDSSVGRAVTDAEAGSGEAEHALAQALGRVGVERDEELLDAAREVRRTSGLDVDQRAEIGEDAEVQGSGLGISLASDPRGSVKQRQKVGKSAKVTGSPLSINVGRPTEPGDS